MPAPSPGPRRRPRCKGLAKQRFRWSYGTLQCLWKYRRITFNPRYGELGMVALPQVWLFQILLTALAPVADLLLVWQLVGEYLAYIQHPNDFTFGNLKIVLIYYAVFMVVDLRRRMIGFLMEKGEDWTLLWWLPLQRFGYRQIMYYVVLRSIVTALRGPFVGWGKLERTGMTPRPGLRAKVYTINFFLMCRRAAAKDRRFRASVMLRRNWRHDDIARNSYKNGRFPCFPRAGGRKSVSAN